MNKIQGRNGLETDFQSKILEIRCQYAVFISPTLEIYNVFWPLIKKLQSLESFDRAAG